MKAISRAGAIVSKSILGPMDTRFLALVGN